MIHIIDVILRILITIPLFIVLLVSMIVAFCMWDSRFLDVIGKALEDIWIIPFKD